MKEKNIGDKVWWATCGQKHITLECPVCFTKKEVILILGNGEQIKTSCDYCRSGFSESSGYVKEYQLISDVKEIVITGKEIREDEKERKIEYRYQNYCLYDTNIFDTKDEAENRVKEMIKEHEEQELNNIKHRKKINQTHYSWSVGYYKKKLKDAQKDIDYYSKRLKLI